MEDILNRSGGDHFSDYYKSDMTISYALNLKLKLEIDNKIVILKLTG